MNVADRVLAESPHLTVEGYTLLQDGFKALVRERRWHRFLYRLLERARWHVVGQLLWLVRRPYLRYLPYPYPATGTAETWAAQADTMVKSGAYSRRHFRYAKLNNRFTLGNLSECIGLRNRMGMLHAFLEDPLLPGMLAAMKAKGVRSQINRALVDKAKHEDAMIHDRHQREEAVRTLVGPRGGLPSLKADLLRLAALCHVEVSEKDTVEQLKTKVKPIVDSMKDTLVKPSPKRVKPHQATNQHRF